ncbi:MAG: glycosyltransferase [Micrococcales bacterium]|nr:glycosyltransferase [Micrococcales bacterium]
MTTTPPTDASPIAPAPGTPTAVAAVIPALNEADRIAATITAVQAIGGVDLVVVVDDGSSDETAAIAESAGAVVERHSANQGKAAAMSTGAARVRLEESRSGLEAPHAVLFVDADLAETAANLGVLIPPILTGQADLTIATLPPQRAVGGGKGRVVRLAQRGIEELTGFRAVQPLSGQRCLTRAAMDAATPLAAGWGVEVGMTVDVLRAGLRIKEVPCELQHRVTGSDWSGQMHRARQLKDVSIALAKRGATRSLSETAAAPVKRVGGKAASVAQSLAQRARTRG